MLKQRSMTTKEEGLPPNPVPAPVHLQRSISGWRTAAERVEALRAKKQSRRAAHKMTLRRSHAKG